jgi:hypothetical protein
MIRDIPALHIYLAQRATMPFAWWANDCITQMQGAVLAQGGADCLEGIAPWSNEEEAVQRIAEQGGIIAAMDARFARLDGTAQAMRGDIGYIALPGGKWVLGSVEVTTLVGPDVRGHRRYPRHLMTYAWSAL